jgi:hypothetical protein
MKNLPRVFMRIDKLILKMQRTQKQTKVEGLTFPDFKTHKTILKVLDGPLFGGGKVLASGRLLHAPGE